MAYVKKNIVTEGLSGKLGNNIVFRNRGGKTVVAVKPDVSNRETTEAQKYNQGRFRRANQYAKTALKDPIAYEQYAARTKPGQSAYNVAMADFMHAPDIEAVDLGTYQGAKGSQLLLQVTDDHMVTEVVVSLYDAQGGLLEEGPADLHENGIDWVYTTQKANNSVSGTRLHISATDVPGNTTEREEVIA